MMQFVGVTAIIDVGGQIARAEEPPHLSLQSSSDFASYGALYRDLTASFSPFGRPLGAGLACGSDRVREALQYH
jgi:hypothetical protein